MHRFRQKKKQSKRNGNINRFKRFTRKFQLRALFYNRHVNYSGRIRDYYLDGDLAVIACNVENLQDIISRYSVKNYEGLNPEFMDYILDNAQYIPQEYPIVLEICGTKFNKTEQEIIRTTIEDDTALAYGNAHAKTKRTAALAIFLIIGFLVSLLLMLTNLSLQSNTVAFESVDILFWFFMETLLYHVIVDGAADRNERALYGRLASVQIRFETQYDDTPFTESESNAIIAEILESAESAE